MRFSVMVIVLAMTPLACSGPNMMPHWNVDIVPPAPSDVDQVAASARGIGFTLKDVPQATLGFGGDMTAKRLQVWEWPARPSTSIAFFQDEKTGDHFIVFEESQTEGLELVGEPCAKYLDLVRAMKARFGAARLRFYKETCDPGRQ